MKKLLLSLGSITAVVAPVASVVACGTTTGYTDAENKLLATVKSSDASKHAEVLWQTKLINDGFKWDAATAKAKGIEAFKYFIENQLMSDPTFLTTLTGQVKVKDQNDSKLIIAIGGDKTYITKKWSTSNITPVAISAAYDLLTSNKYESVGIKMKINKMLITNEFLKLDRTVWSAAFDDDAKTLSPIESALKGGTTPWWVLSKDLVNKHLSYQWGISLDDIDSNAFVGHVDFDKAGADAQLVDATGLMGSFAKYTKKKALSSTLTMGGNPTVQTEIGYKGKAVVAEGKGKLDFTLSGLRGRTDFADWNGYLQKEDLVTDEIKAIQDRATVATLTKAIVVMPIADGNDLTYKFGDASQKFDPIILGFDLFNLDNGIYTKAITFFTEDIKDKNDKVIHTGIKLEIANKAIAKIWIDNGLKFIKDVA